MREALKEQLRMIHEKIEAKKIAKMALAEVRSIIAKEEAQKQAAREEELKMEATAQKAKERTEAQLQEEVGKRAREEEREKKKEVERREKAKKEKAEKERLTKEKERKEKEKLTKEKEREEKEKTKQGREEKPVKKSQSKKPERSEPSEEESKKGNKDSKATGLKETPAAAEVRDSSQFIPEPLMKEPEPAVEEPDVSEEPVMELEAEQEDAEPAEDEEEVAEEVLEEEEEVVETEEAQVEEPVEVAEELEEKESQGEAQTVEVEPEPEPVYEEHQEGTTEQEAPVKEEAEPEREPDVDTEEFAGEDVPALEDSDIQGKFISFSLVRFPETTDVSEGTDDDVHGSQSTDVESEIQAAVPLPEILDEEFDSVDRQSDDTDAHPYEVIEEEQPVETEAESEEEHEASHLEPDVETEAEAESISESEADEAAREEPPEELPDTHQQQERTMALARVAFFVLVLLTGPFLPPEEEPAEKQPEVEAAGLLTESFFGTEEHVEPEDHHREEAAGRSICGVGFFAGALPSSTALSLTQVTAAHHIDPLAIDNRLSSGGTAVVLLEVLKCTTAHVEKEQLMSSSNTEREARTPVPSRPAGAKAWLRILPSDHVPAKCCWIPSVGLEEYSFTPA
ncbi:hypothetical protein Z043_108353 [Scleropages formosus]|uniref:Uncharacterized protein n=1 Tax=Scleropages formosus TaxID=113540 RepID=A0A0P7X6S2_SCLFO|nr:hypothetical protein Z043_108353 [Scleropages formosus]